MKIETKYFQGIMAAIAVSMSGIATYNAVKDADKFKSVDDLKTEIAQKSPKLYDSLMNDGVQRHSFADWQYEVNRMNDSIRTDSLVKRAYFEGAQMVRDSLNKENK